MSPLQAALGDYLAVRRALGYRLQDVERHLVGFVSHLDANGIDTVTVAVAVGWATSPATASTAKARAAAIRGFTRYLQALDPAHEVLPRGVVPARATRAVPHLYSDDDITALMAAARSLQPASWAATVETVIGLLWATGMRVGEVFRLNVEDFHPDDHVVTVWLSKFGKSRLVPLSASASAALDRYCRTVTHRTTGVMFAAPNPRRSAQTTFNRDFTRLLDSTGISARVGRRPRAYDLRHSFAVRTLLGWYRDGADVQALLPRLSTYLGHVEPRSTYWYLTAAPELMALAAERLERHDGADR